MNTLYFKEQLWGPAGSFRYGGLAGTFPQMNGVTLSLQGKQVKILVFNGKILAFENKGQFQNILSGSELESFSVFKHSFGEVGDIKECDV